MRMEIVFRTVAVVIAAASVTCAQDVARKSASAANQKKPAPPHSKVWTDDDMTSLRSPADKYVQAKEVQTAEAAVRQAPAKQAAASKPAQPVGRPALSNPRTLDDADKMIAWENRDAEAQQEFVDLVQKQLNEAPADQKEHLQKLLQERSQVLTDIHKEQQALAAQRKELEKKAAADNIRAVAQPPSQ